MTQKWMIKICNGPHAGAEIPTNSGHYLIGSGDTCDLIFSDPDLAGRHMELILGEEGISICAVEDAVVRVNGHITDADWTSIASFEVITAGTTHFAVGLEEELPIDLEIPEIVAHEEEFIEEPGTEPDEKEAQVIQTSIVRPRLALPLTLVLTVCVVLTAALWGRGDANDNNRAETPDRESITQAVASVLTELEMDHLELSSDAKQQLELNGYVENRQRRQVLQDGLKQKDLAHHIKLNLWVSDLMFHSCNDILRQFDLNLDVVIDTLGQVTLTGFASDEAVWQKARTTMEQDVPGISKLIDEVITAAALERALTAKLNEMPDHNLKVVWQDRALTVTGELNKDQSGPWLTIKEEFGAEYEQGFEIREQFKLIKPKYAKVDPGLEIKAVHIGAVRFITLAGGNKIFEGAVLPGGQTLTRIKHDHLLLRLDGKKIKYPIGGNL